MKENKESGQTTMEYVLLLVAVVIIISSVFGKLSEYLIADGNCPNASFVCSLQGISQGPGYLQGQYKYFTLRRYQR